MYNFVKQEDRIIPFLIYLTIKDTIKTHYFIYI